MRIRLPVRGVAIAILLLGSRAEGSDQTDACNLLANPEIRQRISAALEMKLQELCEGPAAPTESHPSAAEPSAPTEQMEGGTDRLVNNPAVDFGGSTQSETSVVAAGNVICAAFNDSGASPGLSGFGYSQDGGATWTDGGSFPDGPGDTNRGDPSLAYSVRDDAFYYAALSTRGLSLWVSTNDCRNFAYVGPIHLGFSDDKELIAVDNDPSSPYFGRIHVGWTNFNLSFDINQTTFSSNGGLSWSSPVSLPGSGFDGQGMWPAVAPNGHVFFALVDRSFSIGGLESQWIYRSTNGGTSWTKMTDIATNQRRPEDTSSSSSCGRQALGGFVRNLSSPQIAIHRDATAAAGYVVHAVYPADADGTGADESDVFYRRSADGGVTWSPPLRLNDDGTTRDQFYPSVGVTQKGVVGVSWYDRRLDPGNLLFDRFSVVSTDAGLTFGENVRVSDVSSPVSQNLPHFDGLATCYHGDYDQVALDDKVMHIVWSDDRRITGSGPNPDIYYDQVRLLPVVDIDASAEFASTLFGSAASAIANPSTFEIPITSDDPLFLRSGTFDIALTLSQGSFVDPMPSIGPAGSGAGIEPGSALVRPSRQWSLSLLQGSSGDQTLVLRASPPSIDTPVVEGALLAIDAEALVADDLQALAVPDSELALSVEVREPVSQEPIQGAGVRIERTVRGIEVAGGARTIDQLGELDASGTRAIYRTSEIGVHSRGACFGFPSGGLFTSPNCVGNAFRLDPTNDVLNISVSGYDLDPFLASSSAGISVVAGTECESSPVLASISGPRPPGQTFVNLAFAPAAHDGMSASVCLIQDGLTLVPTGTITVGVVVDLASRFLLEDPVALSSIQIVPRCFGDFNGDGRVNNSDALYFRTCFPCNSGRCDRKCDADLNGTVNNFDALQFRAKFGTQCPTGN